MSDSGSPSTVIAPLLDSEFLGSVVVQGLATGIFTNILFRTICSAIPSLRNGRHILLIAALVVLYCLNMINFGVSWSVSRSVLILNNATRQDEVDSGPGTFKYVQVGNGAAVIAILIADYLLVWRCYLLWSRCQVVLFSFIPALFTELGLIPVLFKVKLTIGPRHIPIIDVFFFISMGITVIATTLIIFRILNVSGAGGPAGRYGYFVEIFVESGILYTILFVITGILQEFTTVPISAGEAGIYLSTVLIPVAGITAALISERIIASTARDNEKWSQPVSSVKFKPKSGTRPSRI